MKTKLLSKLLPTALCAVSLPLMISLTSCGDSNKINVNQVEGAKYYETGYKSEKINIKANQKYIFLFTIGKQVDSEDALPISIFLVSENVKLEEESGVKIKQSSIKVYQNDKEVKSGTDTWQYSDKMYSRTVYHLGFNQSSDLWKVGDKWIIECEFEEAKNDVYALSTK